MKKLIKFGEDVKEYTIPVLNEREIRAAAGILFLATFISWMFILFKENFIPIKYVITIFFTDLVIRVFINPRFSPSLILGRLIVRNQTPEYVGAPQKKFAWIIGVVLSATMFFHLVVLNATSPIAGIFCLICLAFLFFESAFGICLGCKFYPLFFKDKTQYCPGEICDLKQKQDIQKTSKSQKFILLGFIAFIFVLGYFFNGKFSEKPYDLLGINNAKQTINTQTASPASVNCVNKGGKLSIVDKPEGQVGMCTLSDGTICDEWLFFRGECAAPSPILISGTEKAIQVFLANKYKKPISEVKVIIQKEAPGFAAGSVSFGQDGQGEGGMWLAVAGNQWDVVWDGNGAVDCNKMRQQYGFPDTILKPNFCD